MLDRPVSPGKTGLYRLAWGLRWPMGMHDDENRIAVVREELAVGKRTVDTGKGVRVAKSVSQREEVVDQPLTAHDVQVERVSVGRVVDAGKLPCVRHEGDTLIVPVLEEVLCVEKRTVLKEELRITSTRREVRKPERVVLRSEQVSVEPLTSLKGSIVETGNTLVAVFDEQSQARQALDALAEGGFPRSKARLTAREDTPGRTAASQAPRDESIGEKIANFFGFGEQHEATYTEAVRRGGCVLVVDAADEAEAERACDIIERYHPVNIDERQAQWRQSGWQPQLTQVGETTLPVVEEQLQVGKREVQRGGVRVISRAIERPVEQTVNLREEHASVERRPADRAATDADQAFKDQSFEVRESAEEPVVGKTARVVEDVVVGKESRTRQKTVKDTVRKTDVEVQQQPGRYTGQERRRSTASYKGMERRGV